MDEHYRKWYKTKRWRRIRKEILGDDPMCVCPQCNGVGKPANVVDHIKPHRGDARLFWDRDNMQPLNKQCHDSWKQREEGGRGPAKRPALYDNAGVPVDPGHHWNEENA